MRSGDSAWWQMGVPVVVIWDGPASRQRRAQLIDHSLQRDPHGLRHQQADSLEVLSSERVVLRLDICAAPLSTYLHSFLTRLRSRCQALHSSASQRLNHSSASPTRAWSRVE